MKTDKAMEMVALIDETMRNYDKMRALWIEKIGNDIGFNTWFSDQVGIKAS